MPTVSGPPHCNPPLARSALTLWLTITYNWPWVTVQPLTVWPAVAPSSNGWPIPPSTVRPAVSQFTPTGSAWPCTLYTMTYSCTPLAPGDHTPPTAWPIVVHHWHWVTTPPLQYGLQLYTTGTGWPHALYSMAYSCTPLALGDHAPSTVWPTVVYHWHWVTPHPRQYDLLLYATGTGWPRIWPTVVHHWHWVTTHPQQYDLLLYPTGAGWPRTLNSMTYCCTPLALGDHAPSTVWPTVVHHWHWVTMHPQQCDLLLYTTGTGWPRTLNSMTYCCTQLGTGWPRTLNSVTYCCTPLALGDHAPSTVWPTVVHHWHWVTMHPQQYDLLLYTTGTGWPRTLNGMTCCRAPLGLGDHTTLRSMACLDARHLLYVTPSPSLDWPIVTLYWCWETTPTV